MNNDIAKRKVKIELRGVQRADGEEASTSVNTAGEYVVKNGTAYLLYEEKSEDGKTPEKSMLKIKDDVVTLSRKGSSSVVMTFETGRTHKTGYITPYGTLAMAVTTNKLGYELEEDRLEIDLQYRLDMNDEFLSENEMKIRAEKCD